MVNNQLDWIDEHQLDYEYPYNYNREEAEGQSRGVQEEWSLTRDAGGQQRGVAD
jgi:hypothetical protein